MVLTDAQAHAVGEVAKTGGKALDLAGGLGAFIKGTVGSVPEDLVGLAGGDWVHEQRRRNTARMRAKTERLLEGIDPKRLSEPSAALVLPLLTAAADESREALQALWAALLANAMVDGGKRVRRDYFEAVRQMEPTDALLLEIVRGLPASSSTWGEAASEASRRGLDQNECSISRAKLTKLECVFSTDNVHVALTPFARGLLAACTVE